jgi:hypothetical protein
MCGGTDNVREYRFPLTSETLLFEKRDLLLEVEKLVQELGICDGRFQNGARLRRNI